MKRGLTIIVSVAIILLASAVGSLWYLGNNQTKNPVFQKTEQPDTDSDGLKDWEEETWGTDPANPDSDGDDSSDGEEVTAGRDPKVASGQDELTDINRRIEVLVRNAQAAQERPLISLPSGDQTPAVSYAKTDLKITSEETAATLKAYQDGLFQAIKDFGHQKNEDELALLLRFVEQGDKGALITLSLLQTSYPQLINKLLALTVPESAAKLHLELLNQTAIISETVFYMTRAEKEPLLALESGQSLQAKKAAFAQTLMALLNYFGERNLLSLP